MLAGGVLGTNKAGGQTPVKDNPIETPTPDKDTPMDLLRKSHFGLDTIACLVGLVDCENGVPKEGQQTDLRDWIIKLIQIALGFVSLLALIMTIYGGFIWLTSSGTPDKVKKGRDIVIWSAIGLLFLMLSWTILSYVIKVAGEM